CEVRAERVRGKGERWEKILVEAAKQSGRLVVPSLEAPIPFVQALASPGVNVMLDPSGTTEPPEGDSLRLFIGPEGGWSDEELAAAREMGAHVWSLGPRRLRAETAAIAACTLLILKPS
ncbi:MAG: 16S rRNA (uracil(1498)-N(3))-methyltransferase, partial [Thermoanaerobaculia bacterium]